MTQHAQTIFIPTEQPALRTAFAKTYAVGPGRYAAFQSAIQIHMKHGGDWQPIDGRFKPAEKMPDAKETGVKEPIYASQRPELTVVAGIASAEPFMALRDDKGRTIAWGYEDAQAVKPAIPEDAPTEKDPEEEPDPARDLFLSSLNDAQGRLRYSDLYPGVTLDCHTDGHFADEFTFDSPEAARDIVCLLKADGYKPILNKDQSVTLADKNGETVFTLCPPFLFDAKGQEGAVRVSLKDDGGLLHICYAPDCQFMETAAYPVVLDPTIRTQNTSTNVEDTYVSNNYPNTNYSTNTRLYATSASTHRQYSFIRFLSLPPLSENHYVTSAKLGLCPLTSMQEDRAFYAREITDDWAEGTVTFNTDCPSFDTDIVLDYVKITQASYYSYQKWDITSLVKKWYKGDANYGVALTPGEVTPCNAAFYSSASSTGKPYLEVEYASLAGVESYWAFDSVSAGKAGMGQVNLATGNMVFLHSDTAMNGARMPVSVTHVYNSCDSAVNPFGCGYGWRTNFHQTLHKEYLSGMVYYVYTDGEGTEHWFKPTTTSGTKYRDESGLSMELVPGAANVTIQDKGDNVMVFPLINATPTEANPITGKVLITSIADACGNTVTVAGSGMQITSITDGAGRITVFIYNGGLLSKIQAPWHTNSSCVAFSYTGGKLTSVQYEDGKQTQYVYTAEGQTQPHWLLTDAVGPEGIHAAFTYANTGAVYGLPHAVIQAKCWDGNSTVASHTAYEYGANLCLVTDQLTNNSLRYHFNDNGNCTSVDDGLGYAVFAEYDQSGENANAPINHPTSSSRIQRVVNNLLKDGLLCKTSGSAWTKYGTGTVTQAINGSGFGRYQRKFTAANGNTLYLRQTVSVTAGKTYTFSGYAQSLGAKAWLRVTAGSQTFQSMPVELLGAETQTELERTQVTFTVPAGVSSVHCDLMGAGTAKGTVAWWDSAQLEEGETANHVNLVENGQMNRTAGSGLPDSWIADTNCGSFLSYRARSACTVSMPEHLEGNVMHVAGRFDRTIRVYQSINVAGKAGDRLTVGGWVSSYAKRADERSSIYCRMHVYFCTTNTDNWIRWDRGGWADFNHEEGTWQFACGSVTAPIDYKWIRVGITLNKQLNYADFSNLFLYREQFGTDYVYDEKGNRKKSTAPSGITGQASYDAYNNILTSCASGHSIATTYNWGTGETQLRKHLLQSVTSPLGTKTSYLYDAYGNVLQSQTEDSTGSLSKYIQTQVEYNTADAALGVSEGVYARVQRDARGKEVTTETDLLRGTVTSTTDPKEQTVSNTYDSLRRLTKTSTMLTSTQEVKSENTYDPQKGYLTSTTHNTDGTAANSVTYSFAYLLTGDRTAAEIIKNNDPPDGYQAMVGIGVGIDYAHYGISQTYIQKTYDHGNRIPLRKRRLE